MLILIPALLPSTFLTFLRFISWLGRHRRLAWSSKTGSDPAFVQGLQRAPVVHQVTGAVGLVAGAVSGPVIVGLKVTFLVQQVPQLAQLKRTKNVHKPVLRHLPHLQTEIDYRIRSNLEPYGGVLSWRFLKGRHQISSSKPNPLTDRLSLKARENVVNPDLFSNSFATTIGL